MATLSDVADVRLAHKVRWIPRPGWQTVAGLALLAIIGFLILYPLWLIALQSFEISRPGEATVFGLDGWRAIFSERGLRTAVWNTLALRAVRQALALPIAVFVAWLIARTDLPGRNWFEFA